MAVSAMSYWAAVQFQSQREKVALHFLGLSGFAVWLPRICERKIIRGARQDVLKPLFPGYLFVAIEAQWAAIRACPGITRVVTNGLTPAKVPDDVIKNLRMREKNGVIELPEPPPRLRPGGKVKIINGLFRDRVGLVAGMAPRDRIIVLLNLLGAEQRVTMLASDVEPMATASS